MRLHPSVLSLDSALEHASHYSLELRVKLVPALTGRGARVLATAGQKLIKVGQWSSSAIYGNPARARHRQRVVALQPTHACTNSRLSYIIFQGFHA